jgi:hypothetical protein
MSVRIASMEEEYVTDAALRRQFHERMANFHLEVAGDMYDEVQEAQRSCKLLVPQLESWKRDGNQAYVAGDYIAALRAYQRGIDLARDEIYASKAHWKACMKPGSPVSSVFDLVRAQLSPCNWQLRGFCNVGDPASSPPASSLPFNMKMVVFIRDELHSMAPFAA